MFYSNLTVSHSSLSIRDFRKMVGLLSRESVLFYIKLEEKRFFFLPPGILEKH